MPSATNARGRNAINALKSQPTKKAALRKPQHKKTRTKTAAASPACAAIIAPAKLCTSVAADPAVAIGALLERSDSFEGRTHASLQQNPFVDVADDSAAKHLPCSTSMTVGLHSWRGIQCKLFEEAVLVSGRSVAQRADAALRETAANIQNDYGSQQVDARIPGHGIAREKDQDLNDALSRLNAQGEPVSASTLRGQTGVAFRACANLLERKADALGLGPQPDTKTFAWNPAPWAARTAPGLDDGDSDSGKR